MKKNHILFKFKNQQKERILQLEKQISKLQEEIRIIQEFNNRIDDL